MKKLIALAALCAVFSKALFADCMVIPQYPPPGTWYPGSVVIRSAIFSENGNWAGATWVVTGTLNVAGTPILETSIAPDFNGSTMTCQWTCGGAGTISSVTVEATSTATGCTGTTTFAVIVTLPVELVSFGGRFDPKTGAASLAWRTASEANCDRFEVERSLDGSNFESIGRAQGHGTTTEVHDYLFEDKEAGRLPSGEVFYRLRQFDHDGANEVAGPVLRIELGRAGRLTLLDLRPGADGSGSAAFFSPDEREVFLEIFGADGKLLRTAGAQADKGPNELPFEGLGPCRGAFFARLTGGGEAVGRAFCLLE